MFLAELDDDEAERFIDQLTRLVDHLREDVPAAASASRAGRGA